MRQMRLHADRLDWAADLLKTLHRIALVLAVLVAIGTIALLLQGNRPVEALGLNSATMQFLNLTNGIVTAISLLVTSLLFRVGFIVCAFLADFARGLMSQQIRREQAEQNKS